MKLFIKKAFLRILQISIAASIIALIVANLIVISECDDALVRGVFMFVCLPIK